MADDREVYDEETAEVMDLSKDEVVTKYRTAADIANKTLEGVAGMVKADADVKQLCDFATKVIEGQCANIFKSKKISKGVAFPPCISVNDCVCHFSPSEADSIKLKAGDIVKIDLGVQIDGFIVVAAHTMAVPDEAGAAAEVTGSVADAVVGAYQAAQVAARLIKPGAKNHDVTKAIERVAEAYGVTPMAGTLSHNLKQYVIDGAKVIAQSEDPEARVDEEEFEVNEVYGVDICFTTGDGKPRDRGVRPTVFKRAVETQYMLKMKSSRTLLGEVNRRFPTMPFNISLLEDQKAARLGLGECVNHGLLQPYPVLYEAEGETVAHFKLTVLLTASGNSIISGLPLPENFKTDKTLPEDLASIARTSGKGKKRRNKKKKAAAAGGGGSA